MKYAKTLTRDEMKHVMAGDGNIYCSYNGHQRECDRATLTDCTDWCSAAWGQYCGGCAQFPAVEG
jgi:hypothetical protein